MVPTLRLAAVFATAPFWGLWLVFTCVPDTLPAQKNDQPRAVIERLFDGMRRGDTTGMDVLFHPDASLQSVVEREGQVSLQQGNIEQWLEGVARADSGMLDEQLHYLELRADGGLATAWTPYTFVLDGEVHHCGTNAFQLMRSGNGWQILNIVDTRRTEGCTLPAAPGEEQRIEALADSWHAAAARADSAVFFGALAEGAVYIGTDPGEHWTKEEFLAFAAPYFAAGEAWSFTARERHVFYDPDQPLVAYWDELLDTWMGPCRGTAVVKRQADGSWKIAHYTLSVAVANELIQDYLRLLPAGE